MKKFNWICLLLLIPAIQMITKLNETVNLQGTIIGMHQDQIKVGKNGAQDRFQVAVKYVDRPSDTIEVPFHYYLEAKVGDKISHPIRTLNPNYEGFFVIGGSILLSFSLLFGIIPFLWKLFMMMKRFKSNNPDHY